MEFKVGDRIAEIVNEDNYYDEVRCGEIIKIIPKKTSWDESKVIVKWDKVYNDIYCNDIKHKIEEEVYTDSITLESLEREFRTIEECLLSEVKNMVSESAQKLKEANELLKKYGRKVNNFYDVAGPLLNVMDDAGWKTSSFNC